MTYDREGEEIVRACACGRLLHEGNGGIVRKLQASLARLCNEYAQRHSTLEAEREELLRNMVGSIREKAIEIMKEVSR